MNISKRKNIILTCFLLLAFCLTAFSGLFINNNKNAYAEIPDGTQAAVSENSTTMYYLSLPVKDLIIGIFDNDANELGWKMSPNTFFVWNLMEDCAVLTNNRVHTFIFTYNNITVNGSALITTWNINCSTDGWSNIFIGHLKFIPKDNININIRSEYYELFQNADFSSVTITYMFNGVGYRMKTDRNIFTDYATYDLTGASLHTRQVSADYDPIEEEGQAPDNGGIAVDPTLPPAYDIIEHLKDLISQGLKGFVIMAVCVVLVIFVFRYLKPKNKR